MAGLPSVHIRQFRYGVVEPLLFSCVMCLFTTTVKSDGIIEVTSEPFRFTNVSASQITYDVSEIIPDVESLGGTFFLDLIKSPTEFISSSTPGIKEYESGCTETSCPHMPVTKSSVMSIPTGHVDRQTIYRIRARARITNSEGVPIFVGVPYPSIQISHAVLHQWGDYNYDGTADAADYTVWRNAMGMQLIPPDGSGNGTVDMADYTFWRRHYGGSVNSSNASSLSTPEPTSWIQLILLGIAASICRIPGLRLVR